MVLVVVLVVVSSSYSYIGVVKAVEKGVALQLVDSANRQLAERQVMMQAIEAAVAV